MLAARATLNDLVHVVYKMCDVDGNLFGKAVSPWLMQIGEHQQYTSQKDSNKTLESIRFSIGFPILFRHSTSQHQGVAPKDLSCDHVFFVTDMRLADRQSPDDLKVLTSTKVQVYQAISHRKKCQLCDSDVASVICYF